MATEQQPLDEGGHGRRARRHGRDELGSPATGPPGTGTGTTKVVRSTDPRADEHELGHRKVGDDRQHRRGAGLQRDGRGVTEDRGRESAEGQGVQGERVEATGGDAEDEPEGRGVPGSGRRIVLSVAAAMFVAELGDKTMLATATLAAQGNPVLVWIGATIGIILSGFVGVFVGRATGTRLPERTLRYGSTMLFALFGVVLIATNI